MEELTKVEFERKQDGGLADWIEMLEAMSEGDADDTALLMLLIELRSRREALKGDHVPIAWLNDAHLARGHIEGEAGEEDAGPGMIPVYREQFASSQKQVSLPVGEIVAWSGTNRDMGITREIDFRFLRFDVSHGTKLFTASQSPVGLRQIGSIDHDGGEFAEYFVEFTDSAEVGQAVYVIDAALSVAPKPE